MIIQDESYRKRMSDRKRADRSDISPQAVPQPDQRGIDNPAFHVLYSGRLTTLCVYLFNNKG